MAMALARPAASTGGGRALAQDVDKQVAERLRERRVLLGLTQLQLAAAIGVTYQQAHKYEKGVNRLSAGRLHQVAQVLGVGVEYFFRDVKAPTASKPTDRQRAMLELARSFAHMPSRGHQAAICDLARALAAAPLPLAVELLDQESSAIAGS
jgi:transcriptional regulator with XRE-family HTH domain